MTAGIIILFAGYTIASYGVVLAKGYDVRFPAWINPVNPYQWPSGQIPKIPSTQIFP